MSTLELKGINGADPLGFLAAMGVFRVATIRDPSAKMKWNSDRATPYPALETATDMKAAELADQILEEALRVAGFPAGYAGAKAEIERLEDRLRQLDKDLKKARRRGDEAASREMSGQRRELEDRKEELEKKMSPADTVCYGDKIGTEPSLFREKARASIPRSAAPGDLTDSDYFAAFASDSVLDDKKLVKPTSLSFSNGDSGQYLFKDFRTLASGRKKGTNGWVWAAHHGCTEQKIVASLIDGKGIAEAGTGLNWSPSAHRSYALRWDDPGDSKSEKEIDLPMNVTAFLGLAAFPSFPLRGRLGTTGFRRTDAGDFFRWFFRWPLWSDWATFRAIRSLLAVRGGGRAPGEVPDGIQYWCAERVRPDKKRSYFRSASPCD